MTTKLTVQNLVIEGEVVNNEWTQIEGNSNCILDRGEYYLSYNPLTTTGFMVKPETAICVDDMFYILYGDHRKEYSARKTLAECLRYYDENIDDCSSWTNEMTDSHREIMEEK